MPIYDPEAYGADQIVVDPEAYGQDLDLDKIESIPRNESAFDVAEFAKSAEKGIAETLEPIGMQSRIVCFVDLLGTSALMRQITSSESSCGGHDAKAESDTQKQMKAGDVYETISKIREFFECGIARFKRRYDDVTSMIISDSYVISIPDNDDDELLCDFITEVAKFQKYCLLECKQATRGGIARGKMISTDINSSKGYDVIIGEALIFAHDLESKIASYPRVIFNTNLESDLDKIFTRTNALCKDKDKFWYVSYLSDALPNEISKIEDIVCEQKNMLAARSKIREVQKWSWLETYIEQIKNKTIVCCNCKGVKDA